MHIETDIHLAIPETQQFMEVDLSGEPTDALDVAEKSPEIFRDREQL
jgi:hypothetical protein